MSSTNTTPVKPLQQYSKDQSGTTVIPATKRADGTWRKPIRVKEGFVPQEEIPVYQTRVVTQRTAGPTAPVGYDPVVVDTPKEPSKAALKRARAKAKKAQEQTQASTTANAGVDSAAEKLSNIQLGSTENNLGK